MSAKVVKETNIGIYVGMSFGIPIDDGDGHILIKPAREGNKKAIKALIDTAKAYGYECVTVEFVPGVRAVDDDEYAIQQQRLEAGLLPDLKEIGTALDDYKQGIGMK